MLDRLCSLCDCCADDERLLARVRDLISAYRDPDTGGEEAQHIWYGPRINLFERPLPQGTGHRYPCTLADVRAQLARVPEYDLVDIFAIGLTPSTRKDNGAYGTYNRWKYPHYKPVIMLHSMEPGSALWLGGQRDWTSLRARFGVEHGSVMPYVACGNRSADSCSTEVLRRYIVEHVLLHEIGHHVQYQERWRAGYSRYLPKHVKEQFAEDYAVRFNREQN
jgi:hypothetical protein